MQFEGVEVPYSDYRVLDYINKEPRTSLQIGYFMQDNPELKVSMRRRTSLRTSARAFLRRMTKIGINSKYASGIKSYHLTSHKVEYPTITAKVLATLTTVPMTVKDLSIELDISVPVAYSALNTLELNNQVKGNKYKNGKIVVKTYRLKEDQCL